MARTTKAQSREGLRQRKKLETRRALRDAAISLFNENGIEGTTIEQVADRANVSRSTFFRYFTSKDAVLFADGDEQGEKFLHLLENRPPGEGAISAFEAAVVELAMSEDREHEKTTWRQFNELLQNDPTLRGRIMLYRADWADRIARVLCRRRGETEPEMEDRLAAAVCMAASDESGQAWRQKSGPDAVSAVKEAFQELRGLLAGSNTGV
jgi:AcrR family transcriptional regulator